MTPAAYIVAGFVSGLMVATALSWWMASRPRAVQENRA